MAYSKLRNMQGDRRKRTMKIYKGKSIKEIEKNPQEEYEEESVTSYEIQNDREMYKLMKIL